MTGRGGVARVGPYPSGTELPGDGLVPHRQSRPVLVPAFGVRAATFDRIGGFDEAFDGYGAEDTDLAFRADAAGIPILFSAGGHAFHQYHGAFDPPLQHFADIIANATRFHARHGLWPMDGWLDAFARLGLLPPTWREAPTILRMPTADEMEAARVPMDRPF